MNFWRANCKETCYICIRCSHCSRRLVYLLNMRCMCLHGVYYTFSIIPSYGLHVDTINFITWIKLHVTLAFKKLSSHWVYIPGWSNAYLTIPLQTIFVWTKKYLRLIAAYVFAFIIVELGYNFTLSKVKYQKVCSMIPWIFFFTFPNIKRPKFHNSLMKDGF